MVYKLRICQHHRRPHMWLRSFQSEYDKIPHVDRIHHVQPQYHLVVVAFDVHLQIVNIYIAAREDLSKLYTKAVTPIHGRDQRLRQYV